MNDFQPMNYTENDQNLTLDGGVEDVHSIPPWDPLLPLDENYPDGISMDLGLNVDPIRGETMRNGDMTSEQTDVCGFQHEDHHPAHQKKLRRRVTNKAAALRYRNKQKQHIEELKSENMHLKRTIRTLKDTLKKIQERNSELEHQPNN